MKKIILVGFVLVWGALTVQCRGLLPVQNIEHQALPIHDLQKIEQAIIAGGMSAKGWQVSKEKDGLFIGTFTLKTHQATVEILYNSDEYSILYKDSKNLRYDEKKNLIHPRYNKMVANLAQSINKMFVNEL